MEGADMENKHRGWWLLYIFGALVILFMVLPSLIVIPMSFSDSIMMKFPPDTFSLRWYRVFFSKAEWISAFWLSVKLGAGVMGLSTVLGVLAALGLVRGRFPGRELIRGFLLSPMIIPVVVTALAMYYFYAELRLTGNPFSLLVSHTCMATPIVIVIVSATLQNLNPNLEKAAQILGATPSRAFFQIVLPIIRPGVIVGGLFAFILSFDEVVIAAFIGGYRSATLPKRMFENVRDEMDPTVAAVSTVLVLISIALLIIVGQLNRRAQRL
jgi:putative spermidine/putrescine transport system permease protein